MVWEPLSTVVEDWGRLQIIIGNRDLTFYRDVPTIVQGWSSGEPFDDKQATLLFPGITSYEPLTSLPFSDFENVDIWLVDKNNVKVKNLWEGFIGAHNDSLDFSSNGLSVECVGALYQADLFLKAPNFGFAPEDAGFSIAVEMNLRAKYYGLRLKQMNWITYTSAPTRNGGSWNPLLTGWAQELLSNAYSPAFMFDGEQANAINCSADGIWVRGDHGTLATFGDRMPNYGSSTWFNAIFIHLFRDPGLYVTDSYYDRITKQGLTVSRNGGLGAHMKNKVDTPGNWPWKGDAANHPELYYTAIHGTDSLLGYRMLSGYGMVKCFGNAAHYGDGAALTPASYPSGETFNDVYIDMVRTPSGNGYWLLSWGGRVFNFGDAAPMANFSPVDAPFLAIETTPDGGGLYALDSKGRVMVQGNAVHLGQPGPIAITWTLGYRDICITESGNGYAIVRTDGHIDVYGDQPYLGTAEFSDDPLAGGNVSQWTMLKYTGRRPIIKTKDTWTSDWTVTTGTPGVTHALTRDRTVMPNTFFGEGTDQNNCKWRNTKYPNFFPNDGVPPLWPGYYIALRKNQTSAGVTTWQRRMQAVGFSIQVDGLYDEYDESVCRFIQAVGGITVDGIIGPQTWTLTFQPGSSGGDLKSAYIAPLVVDRAVEPFLYNPNGSIIGNNPNFDKSKMRIESYSNFGEKSSIREATISARNEMRRNADPGYSGTVTLAIDPEEGSRFEIKAGDNLLYKGYRGNDILLHIAGAEIDLESGTTSLTVDTKGRDLMTVAAMIERDRTIGEWPLKPTRPDKAVSQEVQDGNIVFDCESKAGFIPYFVTPGALWNVIRIPVGEVGTVVKTEINTIFPATEFSFAMFDRKITANELRNIGNPYDTEDFWKNFPEDKGLLISWGDVDQPCGYYPGAGSEDDPLTGRMVDASSWNFWSAEPPWIWIAFYALENTVISGRLYPGPDAGFNFASVDAIANPMEIAPTDRRTIADFGGD